MREASEQRTHTSIRNTGSPHWRRWLGPENRCLVPFTSFSEHEVLPDGRRPPVWFALGEDRPLAFFADIHVRGWNLQAARGCGNGQLVRVLATAGKCGAKVPFTLKFSIE